MFSNPFFRISMILFMAVKSFFVFIFTSVSVGSDSGLKIALSFEPKNTSTFFTVVKFLPDIVNSVFFAQTAIGEFFERDLPLEFFTTIVLGEMGLTI